MAKRPKPKRKAAKKAGRPADRLYIPDVQKALDAMWKAKPTKNRTN